MSVKISQLPVLNSVTSVTVIPVVNNGVTSQSSLASVKNYVVSNLNQTNEVEFQSSVVFNLALGNIQRLFLTGSINSSVVTNAIDSVEYTFMIQQDSVGGHVFTWPNNFVGTGSIDVGDVPTRANITNVQKFFYSAQDHIFYATTVLLSY